MTPYDFNITEFENTYNLPTRQTYDAIKQLEKEGIISLNETFYSPSVLHFNISDTEELYKFQVANAKFDLLIKTLLRYYGGELFVNFVKINEAAIATQMLKSESDIITMLTYLDKSGFLSYIPKKDKPQLTFILPRMDADRLPINTKKYEERKQNEMAKIKAMIKWAENKTVCRTLLIQRYFGENTNEECGVCDVCSKKESINKQKITDLLLKESPILAQDFINKFPENQRNTVKTILRELIDEGKLHLKENIFYFNI